jgi:hypothetical protein
LDTCCDLLHAFDREELGVGEADRMHVAAVERCGQPLPDHDRDERNRASYRLWWRNDNGRSQSVDQGYLGTGAVGMRISRATLTAFLLSQVDDPTWTRCAPAVSGS